MGAEPMKTIRSLLALALLAPLASFGQLKPAPTIILPGTITANLCAPGVCAGSGGGGTIPPSSAAANSFWRGPTSGSAAAPSFGQLVTVDLPTVNDTGVALTTPQGGESWLSGFVAKDRSYWTEYTCDAPLACAFGLNPTTGNQTIELSTSGNFIQTQVIAAGVTSVTVSSRTHTIHFRLQAGGGGGGGVASNAAGNGDVAGGGSAGGYCEATVAVTPSTAYATSLPVGGTGGANTGANGNAPTGDATVVIGATTYTAKAGNGGLFTATGTALALVSGGANTAASTNCDVNSAGAPGGWGIILGAGAGGRAGQGGSSPFGAGGATRGTTGAGNPATGFGAGGGGALSGASGAGEVGGNGGNSILIVDEYQ